MALRGNDMVQSHPLGFTQRLDDLSTTDVWQCRLYCEHCENAFTLPALVRDAGETTPCAEVLEEMMAQREIYFRHCPHCQQWVCRDDCWEPIQCLCTQCTEDPFQVKKRQQTDSPSQTDKHYSSILGEVCIHCDAIVSEGETLCPECGQNP